MARIHVEAVIDAPLPRVWDELADIGSHVKWMADAATLTFIGEQQRGVGTTFECVTRVGPLRTLDRMTVTEWDEGEVIGVRHSGLVTGEGRFVVRAAAEGDERTVVTWAETLSFPWYLAGPIGGAMAKPVLGRIWRGNLRRLADRCRQPLHG